MKEFLDALRLACIAQNVRFYFRSFNVVYEYNIEKNDYQVSTLNYDAPLVAFDFTSILYAQGKTLEHVSNCVMEFHTLSSNAGIGDIDAIAVAIGKIKKIIKIIAENKDFSLSKRFSLIDKTINFTPFAREAASNQTTGVVASFKISLDLRDCC